MPVVVCVHGISQENKGSHTLAREWGPPLLDGVALAGRELSADALACAFYGSLFRVQGSVRSVGEPHYRPTDVTADEQQLLMVLWDEAARVEPDRVTAPDASVRAATPRSIQAALRALARSRFFAGLAEGAFIGALKQVRGYLREPALRKAAQRAVDELVDQDTRVLIGHSLGSVVAYEALHRYAGAPRWMNVKTFVTLGSPLGIPNLIFDGLEPPPVGGVGAWPGTIERWTNISDDGDVVALVKELRPLFGVSLTDIRIHNGAQAHDVMPYLTTLETGRAVANGL